ncbi:unnamed protein product [Clonostachys byssicola]|uniref:Lysophospholipase n=1 Tax=Clonostachys byssicola TaxID=160290 RepID=A0A9N9Y6U0_9HYPO|nr:unnamed protein product [Clonostachys byssicola]
MAISRSLVALLAATGAVASPSPNLPAVREPTNIELYDRGTQKAPSGYVPTTVDCPSDKPTIRDGSSISKQEKDWVVTRRNETLAPMRDLFRRLAIPEFDYTTYLQNGEKDSNAIPNIGIAFSGGGYRAMLSGAGALAALDSRSSGATERGNLGGLLQSSTYIAGLSGGAWLVGSIYMNNFTTVEASANSGVVWQFQDNILKGPEQYALLDYYNDVFNPVTKKDEAGYERSITDYWGRMLSYQLINATDGGPGYTYSSIAEDSDFKNAKAPLPFLIAIGRRPNEEVIPINSTIYEFTPWELGSSDNTVSGFVPLQWVGSNFTNGSIPSKGKCVKGFDNAGFVMGTSSSLFNQIILYLNDDSSDLVPDGIPDFVISGLTDMLKSIGADNNDIADWTPNPFKGWKPSTNYNSDLDRLTLVDGGEDLQNIPYHPLIQNERQVDVIFSFDNSADTNLSWPDGASPIATYERSKESISAGTSFPSIPGKETFLNLGLNQKPVFFGCNEKNTSEVSPLIVYIPNYPYTFYSNTSTFFKMSYNESERDAMIENGWAIATQLNSTRDANWPACVGCAILHRSLVRTGSALPAKCQECFNSYCWNGTLDESTPDDYSPTLFGKMSDMSSMGYKLVGNSMVVAVAGIVAALVAF